MATAGDGRPSGAGAAGDAASGGAGRGASGGHPPARVALLSVGDELLSGDILDSNAHWIANAVAARGHRLVAIATAGDRVDEIERAVRRAREEADLLLVTGGIGPTDDDLTRDGVAAALGLPLERRADLLAELEALRFRTTDGARRQADLPVGAEVLVNGRGTAPGFLCRVDGFAVAVFPGVPGEMRPMVSALLARELDQGPTATPLRIRCAGLPESLAGERLGELMTPSVAGCRVGVTVSHGLLTVTVRGEDRTAMEAAAAAAAARLGEHVFGTGDARLPDVLVAALAERGATISCAESCTGGLLSGAITSVPGSSAVFERSFVTYSDEAKRQLLGVPAALLEAHGAVSEEVARAMAEGCRDATGAGLALAVTGIAGPDGGTPDKPVGTVHLAVADVDGSAHWHIAAKGSRDDIRARSVSLALELGRRRLLGLPTARS